MREQWKAQPLRLKWHSDPYSTMCLSPAVQPNLAFAPVHRRPDVPVTAGQVVPAPASAARLLQLKEMVIPNKHSSAFVAMNANVLGNVKIGANSSIWYGAVLRGKWRSSSLQRMAYCGQLVGVGGPTARLLLLPAADVNAIEVGSNTNIQDNVVVHVSKFSLDGKARPTVIGNNVTIGEAVKGGNAAACVLSPTR